MTNEELKNIWAQQAGPEKPVMISPEAIWQLAKASERFERIIFWRDTREWLATAVVAVGFVFYAFCFRTVHWLPILAATTACLPMAYVAFLRAGRSAPLSSATVRDHLRLSITSVRQQIALLRSILWWYLGPIALSLILITVDLLQSARLRIGPGFLLQAAIGGAVFFGVWGLNQRAVRTDLEPRLRELEGTLGELDL